MNFDLLPELRQLPKKWLLIKVSILHSSGFKQWNIYLLNTICHDTVTFSNKEVSLSFQWFPSHRGALLEIRRLSCGYGKCVPTKLLSCYR